MYRRVVRDLKRPTTSPSVNRVLISPSGQPLPPFGGLRQGCPYVWYGEGCPYVAIQFNNGMKMIGHDLIDAPSHAGQDVRKFITHLGDHLSGRIETHFTLHDIAKQADTPIGDDRDKICPSL